MRDPCHAAPRHRCGDRAGAILLKPKSTGSIELRSPDPRDKPVIDPCYLSDSDGVDRAATLAGLRMCATISQATSLNGVIGRIARPPEATALDDETLERALTYVSHTLSPVGTCRMGSEDAGVVDPQLRVRGVERLRVANASMMPTIIRGHTPTRPVCSSARRPPT